MKLYILATGKDAKGTQLEYLTKTMLESLGYEYVATNVIEAGGDEIDVLAKRMIPTLGKTQEYPLVCECKAHERPITMDDWLKFQGKVHKQQRLNDKTQGLMIVLNEANGNVKGDYTQTNYNDIQLIQGNELIEPLSKTFHLEPVNVAREEISHLTNQTVVSIDLILYEKEIYWLFSFANGEFSIFDKNYKSLQPDIEKNVIPLLEKTTPFLSTSYKNVRKEFELLRRRDLVKVVICWHLMKGEMTFQDAISDVVNLTKGGIIPEMKDVEEVVTTIPFAQVDSEARILKLRSEDEIDYVVFYNYLLNGPVIPPLLFDEYYQQHIDDDLLDKILNIQHGLKLTDEDRQSSLFLLRHSLSALRYALQPDPMLKGNVYLDQMKGSQNARNHFMEQMLSFLEADMNGDLCFIAVEKLGLRDMKKSITMSLVSKGGDKCEVSTRKRVFMLPTNDNRWALVQATDSFEGEYNSEKDSVL